SPSIAEPPPRGVHPGNSWCSLEAWSSSEGGEFMATSSFRRKLSCAIAFVAIAIVSSPARANLTIVPTFDSSITSDPNAAAIEAGINAAIGRVESHILNPLTVNITFQEGNPGGGG